MTSRFSATIRRSATALLIAGMGLAGNASATLFDRGGGLLYDDVLKVTWLQDANYAKTSGYDANGRMTWGEATTWAANLSFHDSVRNVDYSGWRLPTTAPVGDDWNYAYLNDGSADWGYNIRSSHSELSYMYYVNLGLKGYNSPAGVYQPDFGVFGNGTEGGQKDVYPVKNLQSYAYWSATPDTAHSEVWIFATDSGPQYHTWDRSELYAWAVHPGDVAAVPEPETYAMLLAGLGLLGFASRRRKQQAA